MKCVYVNEIITIKHNIPNLSLLLSNNVGMSLKLNIEMLFPEYLAFHIDIINNRDVNVNNI